MEAAGLDRADIEPFTIDTWNHGDVTIALQDDPERVIASLPFIRCKPIDITTPLVDAGHASPHEVDALGDRVKGSIVLASI